MSTAFPGDTLVATTFPWPAPAYTIGDVFDRPPWERPTVDDGFTPPVGDESFPGSPGFQGGGSFEDPPGFLGDVDNFGVWIPGDGSADDGGTITVVTDGVVTSVNILAHRIRFYTIEVHDEDGDLITRVPQWISGSLYDRVDQASELKFKIAADAEGAADLARPNTVWLRDRWGFVVNTFQIQRRRPLGSGDASYIEVECLAAIAQLGEELVFSYEAAEDSVAAHVMALLALQQKAAPITLGTIDATIADIELPFTANDTTIHAALLALQLALPRESRGHLYVDPQRRLQWRLVIGDDSEQVITRQRNVVGIEAEVDYSRLINRIYMYGEGQDPETRLTLIDAGEAAEYLDDATSQSTWGVQPFRKVDRRIKKPETLLAVAGRILEEFATPPVTVRVSLLDLAKADDAPAGWRDIYIGGKYRVVDTDLSLDTSIEIVGIETDLTRPVPLRVDLANQTRDLSDVIGAILDGMNQPLDVLGDRYPPMGRNLTAHTPENYRAGDTRWNDSGDRGEMHDGDDWRELGDGAGWVTAASYPTLPPTSGLASTTMARITAGDQENQIYKIVGSTWIAVDETYTEASKGALVNNEYVQQFARARVGGIWYKRNAANDDWDAENEFE